LLTTPSPQTPQRGIGARVQIVGEEAVPPLQLYPGRAPEQVLLHPIVVPESQVSSPSSFPFPQS